MSFWANLKKSFSSGGAPLKRLEQTQYASAVAALNAGDVRPLRALLGPNVGLDERDLALSAFVSAALEQGDTWADAGAIEQRLDAICFREPFAEAFVLRSDIRSGRGFHLQDEDREAASVLHEGADEDNIQATRLAPADPLPALQRIDRCRGANDVDGARRAFAQVQRTDPQRRAAHRKLLMALTDKWGGSHEDMFQLARQASASAPAGHPLLALVAMAHFERWVYAHFFEEDKRVQVLYLQNADAKAEVARAHDRWLQGNPSDATVLLAPRMWFAGWFKLVDDRERLAMELRACDRHYSYMPWTYFGDEEEVLKEAYASVGF